MPRRSSSVYVALSLAAGLGVVLGAGLAQAGTQFGIQGNARGQYGALPIPITGALPPKGRILAHAAALASQTGAAPRTIRFAAGQFVAPGNTVNIPVHNVNPLIFQVQTRMPVTLGKGTFCSGCGPAPVGFAPGSIPGSIVYLPTANQFGGIAQFSGNGGTAIFAFDPSAVNPGVDCTNLAGNSCVVVFGLGKAPNTVAIGGPLGVPQVVAPPVPPIPSGVIFATVSPAGLVGNFMPAGFSGVPDTVTSFGGPWTTGRVIVSNPAAIPPQMYTITGSDNRTANGAGSISLVAGGLSQASVSGPGAVQGWLTLTLPEPPAVVALVGALATLALCHALTRRRLRH